MISNEIGNRISLPNATVLQPIRHFKFWSPGGFRAHNIGVGVAAAGAAMAAPLF